MATDSSRRTFGLLLLLALLVSSLACVSNARWVKPSEDAALEPGEGLLVFHLDTDIPLTEVSTQSFIAATHVGSGVHIAVLAVRAGRYRWNRVEVPEDTGDISIRLRWDEYDDFEVVEGALNYSGQLRVRDAGRAVFFNAIWRQIYARRINRSAVALIALEHKYPELLERYPMRYSGGQRDDFLPRLFEQRAVGEAP